MFASAATLPDSSWFVVDELTPLPRALCRPLAHAGRAPPRNDIDGHGDHGGPTDSNGPCHGRGGQQPLPDSSWFVVDELTLLLRALCRPLAHAGRVPPRNDIDGHGYHGGPTDSNGPWHSVPRRVR